MNATTYMRTAVLPVSLEVINVGASSAGSFASACTSVVVEGGTLPSSFQFGTAHAAAVTVGAASEIPILSIRPKLAFNGITNRILMMPKSLQMGTKSNGLLIYRLVMNGALTGASWASVGANSGAETDVAASTLTGGETLLQGFISAPMLLDLTTLFSYLGRKMRLDAFATADSQDVLTLMAQSDTGNVVTRAGFTWDEVR
jgi:hypothetical protein